MSVTKQNRIFRQHQNRAIIGSQVKFKILSFKSQLLVKSDTYNIKPNQTQQNKKMTSLVCTSTLQERKLTDKMTQTVSVIQQSNYKFLKEAVKPGISVLYSSKYESLELRYLLHIS
jgi:hypothetical protein